MTPTAEMLARARAAQYVEEFMDGLRARTDKAHDAAFQRSEYERMTNGMIEIYLGALRDAKASRGVIGRIHG